MGAEIDDEFQEHVDDTEAEAALQRLLADQRFKTADRQKAILTYLVAQRIKDEEVKAYAIAVDVLGRPSNFDSSIDPIVRIEISRLRSTLESFYVAFGEDHDIWISVKKGKYIACFARNTANAPHHRKADEIPLGHTIRRNPYQPENTPPKRRLMFAGLMVSVVAAIATLSIYSYAHRPVISTKPVVYVTVDAANPQQAGEASQVRDGLLTALTQFQTIVVAQPAYASVRANAADRRYSVQLKYYSDLDERSVWWQVTENASGNLLMSGLERVETAGKSAAVARQEIVASLAKRIAANRGVINSIKLNAAQDSVGNDCVVRAEYALEVRGSLEAAANCLERTVRLMPHDPDANAVLARILLAPAGRATSPEVADRALRLAQDAVARAPFSDRAQLALMAAQAAGGRLEAAIKAGNKAVALNPNSPDSVAALGGLLYSAGYTSAGLAMAKEASAETDIVPRCAMVVLALDAFRDARYSEALLWTERVTGRSSLTSVIRAAALGELGSEQAPGSVTDGGIDAAAFKRTVDAVGLPPDLVTMLERGVTKAGADLEPVGSISR